MKYELIKALSILLLYSSRQSVGITLLHSACSKMESRERDATAWISNIVTYGSYQRSWQQATGKKMF